MILLDAYPVIAYLRGERGMRPIVQPLLEQGAITTINAAEVLDRLVRLAGADPDDAVSTVRQLHLVPVVVRSRLAETAARLRARHYHRERCPVSLADCVAAAAALTRPGVKALATSDPALLGVVHAEGGRVHALPDRNGNVWSPPS